MRDRGLFRDLLDRMWLGANHCSIPYDLAELSETYDISRTEIQNLLKRLCASEPPLLRLDKTPAGSMLYSPLLSEQGQARLSEPGVSDAVSEVTKKRIDRTESPHLHLLERRYLDLENSMDCDSFSDWLPTRRFDSVGEVFTLNSAQREYLENISQHTNVEQALAEAFSWLMDPANSDRRPAFANAMRFVTNWIRRTDSRLSQRRRVVQLQEKSSQDFADEMRALLGGGN